MRITTSKVLQELQKNQGWTVFKYLDKYQQDMVKEAIKDTLTVVNNILIKEKGVKIK